MVETLLVQITKNIPGRANAVQPRRGTAQAHCMSTSSFIRTVTVGFGISPNLLTSSPER
jgi:hypothetical protein